MSAAATGCSCLGGDSCGGFGPCGTMENQAAAIECPVCSRVSHHPVDVQTGWCSACNRFTGKTAEEVRAVAEEIGPSQLAAAILHRLELFGARVPA